MSQSISALTSFAISGISIKQDSHGRFCLNDLHKAAGGEKAQQPSNWLRTQQSRELIALLENEDCTKKPIDVVNGGNERGTFCVKEMMYSYAMWVSATFHLAVIRAYDSLVVPKPYALRDLPVSKSLPNALSEILSANLTPLRKIMMLTLASKADKNGSVQIGIHNLADICGIANSTANEGVISLERAGFLTTTKKYGETGGSQPNTYTINEQFRFVAGEVVERAEQKDWINEPQQPPLPMASIPDGMALVDATWLAEIVKNSALKYQFDDLKFVVEKNGGLVLTKCEVDKMKGVLKA